jgi:hypothetical protein
LTVIAKVASSGAVVRVRLLSPCLAAPSADLKGEATGLCAEAALTMRPHLRAFMPGTAARGMGGGDANQPHHSYMSDLARRRFTPRRPAIVGLTTRATPYESQSLGRLRIA